MDNYEAFDGQLENEDIQQVWHRSAVTLLKPGFVGVLLIVLGSLPLILWQPSWDLLFLVIFCAIAFIYFGIAYYKWFNTLVILTNMRILYVEHSGVLSRKTSEVPISNIQNISHIKKGFMQMIFDYGDVEIQTAGATVAVVLKDVEHPYDKQQKILRKEDKKISN